VTVPTSSRCVPCAERRLNLVDSRKWGRCAFCVAVALGGAVMGWSFTLALSFTRVDTRILMVTAGTAGLFSLMLLLHVIAYVRRKAPTAA
jgi:uncharacterized membrane protein YjfL (UPF0719 family)